MTIKKWIQKVMICMTNKLSSSMIGSLSYKLLSYSYVLLSISESKFLIIIAYFHKSSFTGNSQSPLQHEIEKYLMIDD